MTGFRFCKTCFEQLADRSGKLSC